MSKSNQPTPPAQKFMLLLLGVCALPFAAMFAAAKWLPDFFTSFYGVVILTVSLPAAFLFFHILGSTGWGKGPVLSWSFRFGGAAAYSICIVILMKWFFPPPPPGAIHFTVQTVDAHEPTNFNRIDEGSILFFLGADPVAATMENGRAQFAVPSNHRGQKVKFSVEDGRGAYQSSASSTEYTIENGKTFFVPVVLGDRYGRLAGRVVRAGTTDGIAGVTVSDGGNLKGVSGVGGCFRVLVPAGSRTTSKAVWLEKPGFDPVFIREFNVADSLAIIPMKPKQKHQ